jgi:hypothetical protein
LVNIQRAYGVTVVVNRIEAMKSLDKLYYISYFNRSAVVYSGPAFQRSKARNIAGNGSDSRYYMFSLRGLIHNPNDFRDAEKKQAKNQY